VGGELSVEQEEVLDETVEQVTCRWCGPLGVVDMVPVEVLSGSGTQDGREPGPAG
jgi:hypothetical protein